MEKTLYTTEELLTMREIKVIPTIKNGFSCVICNPKVVIPFVVFFFIISLIAVAAFNRIVEFFDFLMSPEDVSGMFGTIFGFIILILLVGLFMFFAFPFFESWTYAALASAFKDESVSLGKAAKTGLSKYVGMVIITIIVAIVSAVVGFVASFISSFFMIASMSYSPSPDFPFLGFLAMYGVMFFVIALVTVLLLYLKPAYVAGDKKFSESIKDGFETAKENFLPTLLIYLFFLVVQILLWGAALAALVFSGIVKAGEFFYQPDFGVLSSVASKVLPVGLVVLLVYVLLNTVLYAALMYGYMDSHEMIAE